MAALLRGIFARNKCLLPSRKLLTSSSMCTQTKFPRLVKDGWEFCLYYPNQSVANWLRDSEVVLPDYYSQRVVSIKHLDSGIAFRFSAADALYKRLKEKETMNPLASDFPSYNSPLLSEFETLFDSAYVGRVVIEKQSEEPIDLMWKDVDKILDEPIDPKWKTVDRKTLDEQIVWMTKIEHVSGVRDYRSPFKPQIIEAQETEGSGMLHCLVNYVWHMYDDAYPSLFARSFCRLYLVITDFGWFLRLEQPFSARCNRVCRLREMTMHCFFKQNIIYTEITETQHENFEKRLSEMAIEDIPDDEPLVYFHEVKQLRIQETDIRAESEPLAVCAAAQYGSFHVVKQKNRPTGIHNVRSYSSDAIGALKTAAPGDSPKPLKALTVPDSVIESLFACGKLSQHIEEHFGSSIQILPFFRHPYNPRNKGDIRLFPSEIPRKVYVVSSEYTEEYIKSVLSTLTNLANSSERSLLAPAKTAAKASKPKKRTSGGGLQKPVPVSSLLRDFVGTAEASRAEAVKKIWAHIKEHKLQNPSNKKEIVCDATLRDLFGDREKVNFLEIGKLLSPHFIKTA